MKGRTKTTKQVSCRIFASPAPFRSVVLHRTPYMARLALERVDSAETTGHPTIVTPSKQRVATAKTVGNCDMTSLQHGLSKRRQAVYLILTAASLVMCIILTILPLLPRAAVPLLRVHTATPTHSLETLQGIPAAVVKPIVEVTRLGSPEPQGQQDGKMSTKGYASTAVEAGFIPVIDGHQQIRRQASHGLEDHGALAKDEEHTEEYQSLRHAGLSDAEALIQSRKAIALLDGQKIAGRDMRVGTLDICSAFEGQAEHCETVSKFKGQCFAALPVPPVARV